MIAHSRAADKPKLVAGVPGRCACVTDCPGLGKSRACRIAGAIRNGLADKRRSIGHGDGHIDAHKQGTQCAVIDGSAGAVDELPIFAGCACCRRRGHGLAKRERCVGSHRADYRDVEVIAHGRAADEPKLVAGIPGRGARVADRPRLGEGRACGVAGAGRDGLGNKCCGVGSTTSAAD